MHEIAAVRVIGDLLHDCLSKLPRNMVIGALFAGDRASCVEFGTTVFLPGSRFAGLVTVAPQGEMLSGKPTIVGIYVFPEYRRQGYGKAMLQHAIEICVERDLVPIHVDAMSTASFRLIESLPEATRQHLEVVDNHGVMDIFGEL